MEQHVFVTEPQSFPAPKRATYTFDAIVGVVEDHYRLPRGDLLVFRHKKRERVHARWIAFYLLRQHGKRTINSYPLIGARFSMDHTTILYGVQQVEKRIAENDALAALIADLTRKLEENPPAHQGEK